MTLQTVAFGMPFVAFALMGVLVYGVARYNRRPEFGPPRHPPLEARFSGHILSWNFQDRSASHDE
jgi:hypothetical protein